MVMDKPAFHNRFTHDLLKTPIPANVPQLFAIALIRNISFSNGNVGSVAPRVWEVR